MKKPAVALFPAWLLLVPAFTFAQLTDGEQTFAQKCRDNVNVEKNQLSAATALECVKKLTDNNGEFLARLRDRSPEMGEAAANILSFNSALIDLKNIVTRNSGRDMAVHLGRVLESGVCPLCAMGLGPKPEMIFDWVGKEAGPRLSDVKRSARTWESLGDIRTCSLVSADFPYDKRRWNSLPIMARYAGLGDWAANETDKLAEMYGGSGRPEKKPDPLLISVLREDLISGNERFQLSKLDQLLAGLDKMGDGKEGAGPLPADKKAEELAAASKNISGLKGKPAAEQAAYLSGLFDQAGLKSGGVPETGAAPAKPGGFVFKKLSVKQASGLAGRLVSADARGNLKGPLADELRGTKAGDEILSFYKDPKYAAADTNRLSITIAIQSGHDFGEWSPVFKTIKFNSERINAWMEKNRVRPEQLLAGDPSGNPYLQKLARHLAPTFVHEATHQRQDAAAAAAGIDYKFLEGIDVAPYQMEQETEAFAMDNSFVAEQLRKRGASYADNLDLFDKRHAELFLEKGVEGVRLANHRDYSQLDSLEGQAAKEFDAAALTARTLKALETRYQEAPGTMDKDELARMKSMRAYMDLRFKWYTTVRADSAAVEAKINGWRNEINGKLYPPAGPKAPPALS